MTSSPSLFWKLVRSLWPHLTPQQPRLLNIFLLVLHLPDPALHPPCHCWPCSLLPLGTTAEGSSELCWLFCLQGPLPAVQLPPPRACSKACFAFQPHTAVPPISVLPRTSFHTWMKRWSSRMSFLTIRILPRTVSLVLKPSCHPHHPHHLNILSLLGTLSVSCTLLGA